MIAILYIGVLAFSIYYGAGEKKYRTPGLIASFFAVGLSVINISPKLPDFESYKWYYSNPTRSGYMEKGYTIIANAARNLGIEFEVFRALLIIITLIMIIVALNILNANVSIFFGVYLLFPFFIQITMLRTFVMMGLVFLALAVLKKKTIVRFLVGTGIIVAASTIHSLALFFIPVLLFSCFKPEKQDKIVMYTVPAISILMGVLFFIPNRTAFFIEISHLIPQWITNRNIESTIRFYSLNGLARLNMGLMWISSYFLLVSSRLVVFFMETRGREEVAKTIRFLYAVSFIGFIGDVLLLSSRNFERLIQIQVVIFILMIAVVAYEYTLSSLIKQIGSKHISLVVAPIGAVVLIAILDYGFTYGYLNYAKALAYVLHLIK